MSDEITYPCDCCGDQFTEDGIDQAIYDETGRSLCHECSEEEGE